MQKKRSGENYSPDPRMSSFFRVNFSISGLLRALCASVVNTRVLSPQSRREHGEGTEPPPSLLRGRRAGRSGGGAARALGRADLGLQRELAVLDLDDDQGLAL